MPPFTSGAKYGARDVSDAQRLRQLEEENARLKKRVAEQHRRFGVQRLHALLRREVLVVNHNRTERLYHEVN